jgi:HemY protein
VKSGLYVAGALIVGALLANFLLSDPGYAALRLGDRLIEMSAVTLTLVLIAAYFLVRLLIKLIRARQLWKASQEERRQERARRGLARGILEMSEGDWEGAENTLTRSARESEVPAAHYLVAARAAELLGSARRRDDWLAKALEVSVDRRAPALIMQAELHLKHKQLDAALTALSQIDSAGELNAHGVLLLARIYRQTGDWQQLQALEPRLRSTRGITTAVADETVTQIYVDRLKAAANAVDATQLRSAWKDMPKSLSQRPDIVIAYSRAALACDEHEAAEAELRDLIKREWDEAAILLYGELETDDPLKTLETAEGWLPAHPEDPALLFTCARLSMQAELYGKARTYLETSIAIRPRLEAYQLLASLFEQLGDRERAVKALNDALVLAVGRKTKVPKIRARRWLDRRQADRRRNQT